MITMIIFYVAVWFSGFFIGYGIGKKETHKMFKKIFPYLYDDDWNAK